MEIGTNPEQHEIDKTTDVSLSPDIDPDEVIGPETVEALPETANDVIDPDEVIEPETVEALPETASDAAESGEATLPEGEGSDVAETERHTTKEERVAMAKHSDGKWSGEPGNSELTPNDVKAQEELAKRGVDSIKYRDGDPDFSTVAADTVEISNMTSDLKKNSSQAYKALADKWNEEAKDGRTDWTSREVKDWKHENNLELHECPDLKTCQFVPAEIHQECKHMGGRAEASRRDAAVSEGGFDD